MNIISRSFFLLFFPGSLYWTCLQPNRAEPYLVSFVIFFILSVLYADSCGAVPDLRIKTLGFKKMKPGVMPVVRCEIENVGNGDARGVEIETRMNVTWKKKNGESLSVLMPARNPKKFLSKGRSMSASMPFVKKLTACEIGMIDRGELSLSAYSVIRYMDERRKKQRELRTCSVYNPKTQGFEKTFCFCVGEEWPYIGVNEPVSAACASC